MKFYKTYQECKIANPNSEVIQRNGDAMFLPVDNSELITMLSGGIHCKPSEYLISVKDFFDKGHVFLVGDYFLNQHGQVIEVGKRYEDGIVIMPDEANYRIPGSDEHCYILRASAMEIPTQSPEEREALDMIDTTSKQVDSLAKGGPAEWDGKGLPPVGVECEKIFDGISQIVTPLYYDDHKSGMVMFYYRDSGNSVGSDYDWCLVENCIFRKLESPEQKAERERLEAAFEVYLAFWSASKSTIITMNMSEFKDCSDLNYWLAVVDKTGYRKQ